MSINNIQKKIITWGESNFQDFFWRSSDDGYVILLSEILLQRTKAIQVNNFIKPFISRYPSFQSIASAPYLTLYDEIRTLGLHWRIQNLHKTARIITEKYNGNRKA